MRRQQGIFLFVLAIAAIVGLTAITVTEMVRDQDVPQHPGVGVPEGLVDVMVTPGARLYVGSATPGPVVEVRDGATPVFWVRSGPEGVEALGMQVWGPGKYEVFGAAEGIRLSRIEDGDVVEWELCSASECVRVRE